jgi:hypothetical protein
VINNRHSTVTCPAEWLKGEALACSKCTYLERALESRHKEYHTACSRTLRRISLKFAAYDFVEMQRARSELDMHRSTCTSAIAAAASQHSQVPERVLSEA